MVYLVVTKRADMFTLVSRIDSDSDTYRKNHAASTALTEDFKNRLRDTIHRSDHPHVIRHKERGRLLVRERIELLLDPGTPFLEFSALAANGQYRDSFPSAGIVTGMGMIHGRLAVIIANDSTVKGGTYVRETIKKHLRALDIALENALPAVYLVDSGGIFLPEQAHVFADKEHFGRIFFQQARLSAQSIPQIAVVMGPCTAGGAYIPAMSDETIMVKNLGTIYLAGPPLVKAATGEEVTAEELGGAEVHTRISGVADHLAQNEQEALVMCRNAFEHFPVKAIEAPHRDYDAPLYDIRELYGVISADSNSQIDPYEVIARLVDGSRFHEFKKEYGTTLVTGFAEIMGYPVGIIANNGILFSESALKGTHFVELCNHRKVPILFLQNITGFMVGKEFEHGGIAKDGAKMVNAVANSTVPKITLITGGSYGAGNYAMAGRAYNPRFLFCWPNTKISVMGGEQASHVLATVKTKGKSEGNTDDVMKTYHEQSSVYYSTSRLWDDGIVDPADTRKTIGLTLAAVAGNPIPDYKPGVFRM